MVAPVTYLKINDYELIDKTEEEQKLDKEVMDELKANASKVENEEKKQEDSKTCEVNVHEVTKKKYSKTREDGLIYSKLYDVRDLSMDPTKMTL